MLISDEVHIWRDPEGDYHIEWQASHPDTEVTVEPLTSAGAVAAHYSEHPRRTRLTGLPPSTRHFFRLRDQHGTEVVATERKLGMQGTPNFRDFGGYRTTDGRRVKWGYLFRSGRLCDLSEQDVALLASLGLDLVCDFRRVEEQETEPSRLPPGGKPRVVSLPIVPGSNSQALGEGEIELGSPEAMFEFMVEINRDFASGHVSTYARMFREILAVDDARFLVHCAAGKDRTGFAAAIVLLALGVSEEVVMRDYLLTREFYDPRQEIERIKHKYQLDHLDAAAVMPMLEVHEDYLARALQVIEQDYDSLESYLFDALALGPPELAELRRRYVE